MSAVDAWSRRAVIGAGTGAAALAMLPRTAHASPTAVIHAPAGDFIGESGFQRI